MTLCLSTVNIQPEQFWKLTLPELEAIVQLSGDQTHRTSMNRAALNALCLEYPDRKAVSKNGS